MKGQDDWAEHEGDFWELLVMFCFLVWMFVTWRVVNYE